MPHYLVNIRTTRRTSLVIRAASAADAQEIVARDVENNVLPAGETIESTLNTVLTDSPYRVPASYAADRARMVRENTEATLGTTTTTF